MRYWKVYRNKKGLWTVKDNCNSWFIILNTYAVTCWTAVIVKNIWSENIVTPTPQKCKGWDTEMCQNIWSENIVTPTPQKCKGWDTEGRRRLVRSPTTWLDLTWLKCERRKHNCKRRTHKVSWYSTSARRARRIITLLSILVQLVAPCRTGKKSAVTENCSNVTKIINKYR
jgi:hypothetical protein